MKKDEKFVVRGEYPQRNAMGGFGSEAQSEEMSLFEARQRVQTSGLSKVRIHRVEGNDGSKYPEVK